MPHLDPNDGLEERLASLRPGWRGRLVVSTGRPNSGACENIIGTVISDDTVFVDEADEETDDAFIVVSANFHNGTFGPVADQPHVAIRLNNVLAADPM